MNQRGITPVVATVLLLLLTVGIGGFTYVWMTRTQKKVAGGISKRFSKMLGGVKAGATIESAWPTNTTTNENLSLSIRNTGSTNLKFDRNTTTIYCNKKPATYGFQSEKTIKPGNTQTFKLDCSQNTLKPCCCPFGKDSITLKISSPKVSMTRTFYNETICQD